MGLSKKPNAEGPKKPTPSEMALISRFMSEKIGKPKPTVVDKKAVQDAFQRAQERGVVPKAKELPPPTTMATPKQVSESQAAESKALISGDKEAIDNALIGYNANRVQQGFIEADAYKNTIDRMAKSEGMPTPLIGSEKYNEYSKQIEQNKGSFSLGADERGEPILTEKMGLWESFMNGYDAYNNAIFYGKYYQENDPLKNIRLLEAKRRGLISDERFTGDFFTGSRSRKESRFARTPNQFMATLGGLQKPITDGAVIGLMTAAYNYATGGTAAIAQTASGIGMFGTVGQDMVNSRYGSSLEENYFLARQQNMSEKDAYEKAVSVAKQAAVYETAAQIPFSFSGAISGIAGMKGLPSSSMKLAEKAPAIEKSIKTFAKGFAENAKAGLGLSGIMALGRTGTDIKSEQEGINIENNIERAITEGGHMMAMHMGIHALTSAPAALSAVPKSFKSFAKKLLSTDESTVMSFIDVMESAGLYNPGTKDKIKKEIKSYKNAENKTPKFGGDEERRTIASGLIEKRTNLEKEMSGIDKEFQAPIQVQIDEINTRLRKLNEVENPFEVEITDEGKPFTTKTQEDATKISTGQVQESTTESGVSQYQGVEEVKPVEVAKQTEVATADIGDSPVISEAQQVKLSDKIRRLKIDESVLTGGDKGVAQSNIAGLPIGIYNASVEAIALSVEAGETIAAAIQKQIKSLREGGYEVDEARFTKNVNIIEKVNTDKARLRSEAEMEGINSADYAELQRIALEKYNENEIYRDPVEMGKILRRKLSEKGVDTSKISDDVFETIGYSILDEEAPFLPGTAKKIPLPTESYSKEQVLTNPREVFKAIYRAAETQAKEAKQRLSIATKDIADAIAESVYKSKGLRLNPKSITRAIKMFVNDKMDTETASIAFQENINEIRRAAENSIRFGQVKKLISNIRNSSKSSTYGTIATRETTRDMDFMAPSKIRDYDKNGNVLDTDTSLNKYEALLEDYRKSISGESPDAKQARVNLSDFLAEQRDLYENAQIKKREAKKAEYEAKYDKLLAEGKISIDEDTSSPNYGKPAVSKEEFVEGMVNPNKEKTQNTEDLIGEAEAEEAPSVSEQIKSRQEVLLESIQDGEIETELIQDAKELAGIDVNRVSPNNLKRLSNIIEDILNGEEPSWVGQMRTDVESNKLMENTTNLNVDIRPITKIQKAGIVNYVKSLINQDWVKGNGFDTLGITNMLRVLTSTDKATSLLRSMTIGPFERAVREVNTISKAFTKDLSDVFTGKSATINGQQVRFTSPKLIEKNSYRIGLASALEQVEDFNLSLQNMIESLKYYSKVNADEGGYHNYLSNTKEALTSLGLVDGFVYNSDGSISDIVISSDASLPKILGNLNDRESAALSVSKQGFKGLSLDVRKAARDYYGVNLDISSPEYLPRVLLGNQKDILLDFDNPVFSTLPAHIKKMRASSTFERTPNLNAKGGYGNYILYDFDFFRRIPEKYHETATTAYTSESTSVMSKYLNSKEFGNFIQGKFNADPKYFITNKKEFIKHINEYVNMERKPYVVTKEIAQQRSRLMRFVYGKLLNTWDAAAKQYIPGTITLMTEAGGVPFLKANDLYYKSLKTSKGADLINKFLFQTSQVSRATSGVEALRATGANIDNNSFIRGLKDVSDVLDNNMLTGSASLAFGDNMVTIQGLLVGYMKGLKLSGKLKNYSEFNLESELNNGLDQYALSYAENFLSFINNESNFAGKAKIFREGDFSTLRMLQSFNHNQTTNFLIDLGRLTDSFRGQGNSDARNEAIKRMIQFASNQILFGTTAYLIGNLSYNTAKTVMDAYGVQFSGDKSTEEAEKDKTATRIGVGLFTDAMLGRQNIVFAQGVKAGLKGSIDYFQTRKRKEMEAMGYDASKTLSAKGYSPIFKNDYIGAFGTFVQDAERYYNMARREEDYTSTLEESQKNSLRAAAYIKGASLLFPSRDLERLAFSIEKNILYKKVQQLDYDAYMLSMSRNDGNAFFPLQVKEANDYLNMRRAQDPRFNVYLETKVGPRGETMVNRETIKDMAKSKFPNTDFNNVVSSIFDNKVKDKVLVLNNRYPIVYPSGTTIPLSQLNKVNSPANKEIKFMLENGLLTAEEYAFSIGFDKNGRVRTDISEDALNEEVVKRYAEAISYPAVKRTIEGGTDQVQYDEIWKAFKKFSSERYVLKQRAK